MSSLFKSTKNTRFLPIENSKYIRSDLPNNLTSDEIAYLLKNNVRTIIDLRTKNEVEKRPCPIFLNSEFCYYNMQVTGGDKIPETPNDVSISYCKMVDEKMFEIINKIETSKTKVMYFCNAGKDRTGVVSALILLKMGVPKSLIIKDYMESANNLRGMLNLYAKNNTNINIDVITPKPAYIENFIKVVSKKTYYLKLF